MANLLEAYSNRLAFADKVHMRTHQGQHLSESKKILIAKCLENTQRFINESMSTGTQRSDMGLFTKFSLNLINVALPNLIAPDIVLTHPMSSMSGYVNYVKFVAGSDKGNISRGYVFNDPFRLGNVDPNYTSSRVVKDFTLTAGQQEFTMDWKPVVPGTISVTVTNGGTTTTYVDDGEGGLIAVPVGGSVSRKTEMVQPVADASAMGDLRLEGVTPTVKTVVYTSDGTEVKATADAVDYEAGTIDMGSAVSGQVQVAYSYNNVNIPQNDIPLLSAKMEALPLLAKARRIAIYYSQMAAYQAKTDYGLNLGDQLAEKAVGQLAYEIDTEVVDLLVNNAAEDADLEWSKTLPIGVSTAQHYESFSEKVALAQQKVYARTQRFFPNYMIVSATVPSVLGFLKGWEPANVTQVNGPYLAGTLNGLRVYVSPRMKDGEFVLGVNAGDFMSSAAVYAPYMPIVPTQLLGFADGGMSQGFSTLYDLRILNKDLLIKGRIRA